MVSASPRRWSSLYATLADSRLGNTNTLGSRTWERNSALRESAAQRRYPPASHRRCLQVGTLAADQFERFTHFVGERMRRAAKVRKESIATRGSNRKPWLSSAARMAISARSSRSGRC